MTAARPSSGAIPCVVMTCGDMSEAEIVGRKLLQMNTGVLVTYRRLVDVMHNSPTDKVALLILATQDHPTVLRPMLDWLRRRWPRCPITVIGDVGSGEHEMAARQGGANYLTRPLSDQEWANVLSQVLAGQPYQVMRELPGANKPPGPEGKAGDSYQPAEELIRRP